jgi:hypothetical protein
MIKVDVKVKNNKYLKMEKVLAYHGYSYRTLSCSTLKITKGLQKLAE